MLSHRSDNTDVGQKPLSDTKIDCRRPLNYWLWGFNYVIRPFFFLNMYILPARYIPVVANSCLFDKALLENLSLFEEHFIDPPPKFMSVQGIFLLENYKKVAPGKK